MSSVKDSRNVKKNSGAVQKCCKTLSLLFLRELFQVIQCSQRQVANRALDLANPRESQLLSAWSNQKGRRLDGGMVPPRVSVHHILKWRCWWSTLMPPFEVTSAHSTPSLCGWGVMSWFEVPQEGLFHFCPLKPVQILNSGMLQVKPQMSESALQILHSQSLH